MKSVNSKMTHAAIHATTIFLGLSYFMCIPLLNPYLYNELMFTAVLVGYFASSQSVSSNIAMIFGGPLGNVIGCKATMILGALISAGAYIIFGVAESFPMFFLGGIFIGVGSALYLPASNAYYDAISTDENRAKMFSVYSMLDTSSNVVGPTVGSLLVALTSFQTMALVSAGMYLVTVLIAIFFLPNIRTEEAREAGLLGNIKECAQNKAFLKFLLVTSVVTVIILQRDLTIPVKLAGINPGYSVGFMYALASLIGVVLQIPMVKYFKRRFDNNRIYAFASGLYTLGIAVLGFASNIPMLYVGTVICSIGQTLYYPVKSAQVAEFAGPGKFAGYYGFQGLVGVGVSFLANLLGGYLYDSAALQTGWLSYLPWYVFIAVGAGIVAMFLALSKKQTEVDA